jgi:choice-of-anchor B domain-containing protein
MLNCRFLVLFFLLTKLIPTYSQADFNLEFLANVNYQEDGNDCWGFVDAQGIEYAVIGTRTATRIYSLEDPANPIPRYLVSGASSVWRDIKYYNNHLYVTTDQGRDGLLIIDVSEAPETFSHVFWKPYIEVAPGQGDTLLRTHNIYIDENGIAYLSGHNIGRRGVMFLDLNEDPKQPEFVGAANLFYSHDAYTRGDTLISSELNNGLAIYNVRDKANPVEIARITTSNNFTHNAWLSDDGKFVFTTDEVSRGYVDAYDISDINNIRFMDKYRPLETYDWPVIPHNTHYFQGYNVVSWYTDGLIIFDSHRPDNLVKVAAYDTYKGEEQLNPNSNWFHGCWGAFPYLPSGLMIASDINSGLWIFRPTYERACYLEGKVTSLSIDGEERSVRNAQVELVVPFDEAFGNTDVNGEYKTGFAKSGEYEVIVTHPDFDTYRTTVSLQNGEVTILNIQLQSSFLRGLVVFEEDGMPLGDVQVVLVNQSAGTETELMTNDNGEFVFPAKSGSQYSLLAAKWGYRHAVLEIEDFEFDPNAEQVEMVLEKGYQDHFFADLGWEVTRFAGVGNWERAEPVGTVFNGQWVNPPFASPTALGNKAYVTGNIGGQPGTDDVDDGLTELTSPPMDFTAFEKADISYRTWFFNDGGAGSPPNDSLVVYLSNGENTIRLEFLTAMQSASEWSDLKTFEVTPEDMAFTENMRLHVTASDFDPGHLVEGGFDEFLVVGTEVSSVADITRETARLYPNPAMNVLHISNHSQKMQKIRMADMFGRMVYDRPGDSGFISLDITSISPGMYIVEIQYEGGHGEYHKLMIAR